MVKILFHRQSSFVKVLEVLAVVVILIGLKYHSQSFGTLALTAFALCAIFYSFISFVARYKWYKDSSSRGHGIERHFARMMVVTTYLMLLIGLALFLELPSIIIYVCAVLLMTASISDIILLYLHNKDNCKDLPSLYTRHQH